MIFKVDSNTEIDTERDLGPEERHILQKLLGWKSLAGSMAEFQEKKRSALSLGWNNSGPVRESEALTLVVQQLEKELHLRLKNIGGQNK